MIGYRQRPFLVDPTADKLLTYGDFEDRLRSGLLPYRPCLKPQGFEDALVGLATALLAGLDVELYDSDLSVDEAARLGVPIERSTERLSAPRLGALAAIPEAILDALRSSGSCVTLFTSGSTGLPKRVAHPLVKLARSVKVSVRHTEDVWAFAYSPTHIAGVQVFLQALANLNTIVNVFQMPQEHVLTAMKDYGVTHVSATPTFYRMLLPDAGSLLGVRSVTFGGEPTDADLLARLRPLFPNARFHNVYASTEAGTLLVSDGELFSVAPDLVDRVRIREGQIDIHNSLLGAVDAGISGDGEWYATGDRVEMVDTVAGRFRIIGRDRDWLNVGGAKVDPGEVECVLRKHSSVRDARVFGIPNSVVGTLLIAEVVPSEPPPVEVELRQFLAAHLQTFKVPRILRYVDYIDQTRTGKLKRHAW